MKNIFFFLIINLFYLKNLHSQTLFFSQGNIDIRDKTVVSVLNQIHNYNSNIYNRFDLDIDKSLISNRLKIGFQYSNYFNYAGFSFEPSGIGFAGAAIAVVKIDRFGFNAKYDVIKLNDKFELYPIILVDLETRDIQEYSGSSKIVRERLIADFSYMAHDGIQIIPSLGIGVRMKLFWKIYLKAEAIYSRGHSRNTTIYFDYAIDNVNYPRAEWYTDGTGFIQTVGLGIRFWEWKKR